MQVNATAIEFFAFIGFALWLVLGGAGSARSPRDDAEPAPGEDQEPTPDGKRP